MPTIVRVYSGHCKLRFDLGAELEADFKLQLRSDGDIDASVTLPETPDILKIARKSDSKELLHCSLAGTVTEPEGRISIPGLLLDVNTPRLISLESTVEMEYAKVSSQQMVEVHYGLTNFDFWGCEYTRVRNEVAPDKFSACLTGVEIAFKQVKDYRNIISELETTRDVKVTAEAIATAAFSGLEELEQLVGDVATLLSYATGTYISWVYQDVYDNGQLVRSLLYPHNWGPFVHHDWVIDARNLGACYLRIFLETTYPAFSRLKADLGLNVLLEFLVVAKQGRYPEVIFLLNSVAAECLTSYLASYFTRIGKSREMRSFRSKMKELLSHFKVVYDESELDFIGTRDKIVHTGRFPAGVVPWPATRSLQNLMDRTVLTILGYQGKAYLNCAKRYEKEILR